MVSSMCVKSMMYGEICVCERYVSLMCVKSIMYGEICVCVCV